MSFLIVHFLLPSDILYITLSSGMMWSKYVHLNY